jgi:pantoate--beta-alanine ligase
VLSAAVRAGVAAIDGGEQDAKAVVEEMNNILLTAPDAEVEYAQVVDAHTLQPIDHMAPGQDILVAVAVYFGETRLIDNAFVEVPAT